MGRTVPNRTEEVSWFSQCIVLLNVYMYMYRRQMYMIMCMARTIFICKGIIECII